ncbi:MAG: argininosuccinate lyase [Planctomycetes bacterium]|nr:argininosuccinate lyase [Planctomycetota bacterium]
MWQGRVQGGQDALFRTFNDSLPFDRRLVQEDVEGSVAWAAALCRAGVLTDGERARLEKSLREIAALAASDPMLLVHAADEDVHSWVERELVARVGDLGKKLHTGRSRNDQVSTDLRLWCMKQIRLRLTEIDAANESLLELAERERETVFPGFTHLQRAQPILFAHWCLAYVEMLRRDADRFSDAMDRVARCPLGSGALAGTAYPIDRQRLAKDLGFDGPTANSLDAVSDRDFVAELLAAASITMLHLSRMSEDLIFYATGEAAYVELSDEVSTGSSLMPQKKNPDACELIRGKTGRVIGSLTGALATFKSLPMAYNKDLQEDKEPLFDAMDTLSLCLRMTPRVLRGLKVDRERARKAAIAGYANATELADYLVGKGVPFREAHGQVGLLVREAIRQGKPLEGMSVEDMAKLAPKVEKDVYVSLTVDAAIGRRSVPGGTSPDQVLARVREARRSLRTARRPRRKSAGGASGIRDAVVEDLEAICRLVDLWSRKGENLPRSRDEILEKITDFGVATVDGAVRGCASLWVYEADLAEIRSLGVDEGFHGRGLGRQLVQFFIERAKGLGIKRLFVLTRMPAFFEKCGFRTVSINSLPQKVTKDCSSCPKKEMCDEIAMVLDLSAENGS